MGGRDYTEKYGKTKLWKMISDARNPTSRKSRNPYIFTNNIFPGFGLMAEVDFYYILAVDCIGNQHHYILLRIMTYMYDQII